MKQQVGFTIIELVVEATSAAFVSTVSLVKTKAVVQRAIPGVM